MLVMTTDAIKEAILGLPREERLALEEWIADQWDAEMARDFGPGGRGAALLGLVDAGIAEGDFTPLKQRG
jgi:hypothetical protein